MKRPMPGLKWLPTTALAIGSGAGAAAGMGFLPLWTLAALLIPLCLLPRKSAAMLLAGALLCTLSGFRYAGMEKRHTAFSGSGGRVSGLLTLTDSRLTEVKGVPVPRRVRGAFSVGNGEIPLPVSVDFQPAGTLPPPCGQLLVTGVLFPPEVSGFLYDGRRIVKSLSSPYGSSWNLRVKTSENLPGRKGILSLFLPMREALIRRLTARLEPESVRGMAARLFFGVSDGAPSELKSRFVSSGTIHLFAVSGLHVGILAMILLILFRFLPFVWRYYATAAFVLLYVFCSGAGVPAVRAGTMIVCWCILRAHLFFSPGWNILMAAWSILMFFHPAEVGDLGTQYSFGITAALILFWEKFQHFRDTAMPELSLMPENAPYTRKSKRRRYRLFRLLGFFCIAPVAFFSGAAITLARQNLFIPGSVLPNLILPLLTPFLFAAMLFKMTFGALFLWCDRIGAKMMESGFLILTRIAESASEYFPAWEAAEPAWYEVLLFYAAFFSLLGARRFRTALTAGVIAFALLLHWLLGGNAARGEVMILSGMADRPATAVFRPGFSHRAYLLNLPDSGMGALAGGELRRAGSSRAELYFSRGSSRFNGGAAAFSRRVKVEAWHWPAGKITPAFRKNCAELPPENCVRELFPDPRAPRREGENLLIWQPDPSCRILMRDEDQGRRVRVEEQSSPPVEILMPWSQPPCLWRRHFPEEKRDAD